jgi:hypothetical protein
MGYPSSQPTVGEPPPKAESVQFLGSKAQRFDRSLLVETILVTAVAILTLRVLLASPTLGAGWFVAPGVLAAAALIPTAIRKREFAQLGFNAEHFRHSLILVGCVCLVAFPALLAAAWLLRLYGLQLPLRPVLPSGQSWVGWLLYQFLYVAVAEEVYFRGYLQGNILVLAGKLKDRRYGLWKSSSIVVSALCFAVAHVIVRGQAAAVLTFLPGLLLGWLFVRTRSLVAPILFHGLANTWYLVLFGLLATA